jgi:hypothetical protein
MRTLLLLVVLAAVLFCAHGAERRGKRAGHKKTVEFAQVATQTRAKALARAHAIEAAQARKDAHKPVLAKTEVHAKTNTETQAAVADKIKKILLRKRARAPGDNETVHDGGASATEAKWLDVQNSVIDYHEQQINQDIEDSKHNLVAALSMQTVVHNNEQDTIHQAYKASAGVQELQQMLIKQSIATRNNAEVDAFSKSLADTIDDDVFSNAEEEDVAPAPAGFVEIRRKAHHRH